MPGSLNVPGNTSINGDWEVFKMAKMGMRYDADKTDQQQLECGSYYDALDKLCSVVVKMNKFAMDGMEIKILQQNLEIKNSLNHFVVRYLKLILQELLLV